MAEVIVWAVEDAAHIGSRSQRYPGALDIAVEWTVEAVTDRRVVEQSPYRSSHFRASALIGYSAGAGRVLVVLAYRDVEGGWRGLNAWPATGRALADYEKGTMMAKDLDPELVAELRTEARAMEERLMADPEAELWPGEQVRTSYPNRSRIFTLRLRQTEYDALEQVASEQDVPASTLARSWILARLDDEHRAS